MKTIKLKTLMLLAIMAMSPFFLFAQQQIVKENKTQFSIEIDPVTYAFNGYAIHLRLKPKNSDHMLLGVGVYAMNVPETLVNFNKKNKDQGWNARLNQGIGLFAEHYFTEVNKRWFLGAQAGVQEYKIENEANTGSSEFTNILLMPYGGYSWQPFDVNFYIKPWAGVGYTTKVSGSNTLENKEYDISPITMFFTLHLGYTF